MPPLSNFQKSCVALAIGQALASPSASAAIINVGVNENGICTLRDAIVSANEVSGGGAPVGYCEVLPPNDTYYTIDIPAATYSYDDSIDTYYNVDSMLPTISSKITLQGDVGGGTVIARDSGMGVPDFRLLAVESNYSLTLQSITLQNGQAEYGGAIYAYDASVTITNSVIEGNSATTAGAGIFLQCRGDVSITDSTLSNNTADFFGGSIVAYYSDTYCDANADLSVAIEGSEVLNNTAVAFEGGGIYISSGTLQITDTTVQGNQAVSGAAIYSNYSTVILDLVSMQSNTANGNGGGIHVYYSKLTVTESQLTNNSSYTGAGGAIFSTDTTDSFSEVNLDRTSVSNNLAMNGAGIYVAAGDLTIDKSSVIANMASSQAGAIHHEGGAFTMINSTISGNVAAQRSAINIAAGAGMTKVYSSTIYNNTATGGGASAVALYSGALPSLYNTIIAGNSGTNECGGGLIADNNNWFADASCDGLYARGKALLNPLGDNSEGLPYSTLTHAPSLSSGVVNAGDNIFCTAATDQRGAPRIIGTCDIGAVEGAIFGPADEACFVVKAANGNVLTFCL